MKNRKINKNHLSKAAYTLAEIMVVSAMILAAIAYMTSVLRNKMPDADKTTIRHAYGQVSEIVAELLQRDEYPQKGFANHDAYAELVYSNGQRVPVHPTGRNQTKQALQDAINTRKEQVADRIAGATMLRLARFYGGTKFATLFKSMLNIKQDNIEASVNAENTVPICCRGNNCVTASGTFNDTYENNTSKPKMTCAKTNKGITYCIPNNTTDANCFGNYIAAQAETYYMIVKIFLGDSYKNEDGYYLQIFPTGKISVYPPTRLKYGPNNTLGKNANSNVNCDFIVPPGGGKPDTSVYDKFNQCRLNEYLLFTNPHKK